MEIKGDLQLKSTLKFLDNGNFVGFKAPALTADQIWTLPTADGNADDVLTTDGLGVLSWNPAVVGNVEDGTAAGQMLFWDGTNEYKHSETNELFWDDTNKRLGLGTITPGARLEVVTTVNEYSAIFKGGRILITDDITPETGIGLQFGYNAGGNQSNFVSYDWNNLIWKGIQFAASPIKFMDGPTEVMRITDNRVGIGTQTPDALLDLSIAENTEILRFTDSTNSDSVGFYTGNATPEGVVTAQLGSLFLDNANGELYIKDTGDGTNTGWLQVATGAGIDTFLGLTDTPVNYTGSGGKFVRVNATPDALEFVDITAADIPIADAAGNLAASEVEAALAELFSGPTNFLITPSAAPTANYEVANKKYVDDNAGGGGSLDASYTVGRTIVMDLDEIIFDVNNATNGIFQFDIDIPQSGGATTLDDKIKWDENITLVSGDFYRATGVDVDIGIESILGMMEMAILDYTWLNFNFTEILGDTEVSNKQINFIRANVQPAGVGGNFLEGKSQNSTIFSVDWDGDTLIDGTLRVNGSVDLNAAVQLDSTLTVGVNNTGYDVKFYGATAGRYMLWDESADELALTAGCVLSINGDDLTENIIENLREDGKIILRPESDVVASYNSTYAGSSNNDGILDSGVDAAGANQRTYMFWDSVSGDSALQYVSLMYQFMVPLDFGQWLSGAGEKTIKVYYKTTHITNTNNRVNVEVFDTGGTKRYNGTSNLTSTNWICLQLEDNNIAGTWTPGQLAYINVQLGSTYNYYAYSGEIELHYEKDI